MEDLARVFLRSLFPRPYTTPLAPTPHLNPLPQPGTPNPLPPNRHHGRDQQPTSPTPPHKVTAIDPTTDSIQTITTQRGQREGRPKTSQHKHPYTTAPPTQTRPRKSEKFFFGVVGEALVLWSVRTQASQ